MKKLVLFMVALSFAVSLRADEDVRLVVSREQAETMHALGRAYVVFDGLSAAGRVVVNGVQAGVVSPATNALDVTEKVHLGTNLLSIVREGQPKGGRRLYRDCRLKVTPHAHALPGSLVLKPVLKEVHAGELQVAYDTLWGDEVRTVDFAVAPLWTPEKPRLSEYDVYGEKFPYAFRTTSCDEAGGFRLNGRPYALAGSVFDADKGPCEAEAAHSFAWRELLRRKSAGCNCVRIVSGVDRPDVRRLCDEIGLLVWDPSFGPWERVRAVSLSGASDGAVRTAKSLRLQLDPHQPPDATGLHFAVLTATDDEGRPAKMPTDVRVSVAGPATDAAQEDGLVWFRRTGEAPVVLRVVAADVDPATLTFGSEIHVCPGADALKKASAAVRAARRAQPLEPVTVWLTAGDYRLAEPFALTGAESGVPGAPTVWTAEKGVILSGGVALGPWTTVAEGEVTAPIPAGANGRPMAIDMLFVNGRRAVLASLPKRRGVFKIPGGRTDSYCEDVSTNAAGRVEFACEFTRLGEDAAAAMDAVAPEDIQDVRLQVLLDWTQGRRRVVGWDRTARLLKTEAFGGKPRKDFMRWGSRAVIRLENIRAGFTEPGEWLYDSRAGVARYRLLPGESAATLRAEVPRHALSKLLVFRGAHDIRFEGIDVACADAPVCEGDDPSLANQTYQYQSANGYDAAVFAEYSTNVVLRSCRVTHTGNYGFRVGDGCRHVVLERCEGSDLGAGGVWVGAKRFEVPGGGKPERRVYRELAPSSCAFVDVRDCVFREGGRFHPEGTGIFVTHASDCSIEHNLVEDFYYSGITVGYVWGYKGSPSQRNTIAYNRISRIGQGELSDMGGIYLLGTSYGTVVANNVISHVKGRDGSAWGLYLDEGSEGIVMENNVVSHTETGGINQHYGVGCHIRNNIFAYNDRAGVMHTIKREVANVPSSIHVTGNVFYTENGPLLSRLATRVDGVYAHNVWWKPTGVAKDDFAADTAEAYLASGRAYGDVVADPLFVDAKAGDFRLRADSPALKLGFREWDHRQAGPRP